MVDMKEDCWYSIHRIVWLECRVEKREWLGLSHQIHRPISMVQLSFLAHNLPVLPFYPPIVPQPHHQNELQQIKSNQLILISIIYFLSENYCDSTREPFQQYGSQRRALFIHGNMPQPKWIFPIQFGIECGTRLVWPYNQRQWMYWTLSSVWCLATIWAKLCRSCNMWTDWNETNTWTSVSSMNSNLKRISCINNCLSFLERRRRLKMPLCVHQHRQTFHQLQDMKVRRHQNGILKSRRLCIATKNTKDE